MPNIKVVCDNCGKDFYKRKIEIANTNHNFCSRVCFGKWCREHFRGENSPRWKGGPVTRTCKYCGEEFQVPKAHLRFGDGVFCSKTCQGKWDSEHKTGENNPNWKGGPVNRICKYCGEEFQIRRALVHRGGGIFCSCACHGAWISKYRAGENSPRWKGGYQSYYGPTWHNQRRKALERDGYQCQVCGKTWEETSRKPDVHHIISSREFNTLKEANTLSNLITLCRQCHRRVEGSSRKQLSQLLASPDAPHIQASPHQ